MKDVINAKHPLRNKIFSYYNSMVQSVQNHATIPSFCNKSSGSAKTIELEWNGSKYTTTLTDSNNVLSKYNFKASISGVSFSVNGNKLTVSMDTAPSKEFTITATKKNAVRRGVVVWSEGKHGQNSSVQDVVSYAQEVSDSINGYVKMKVSYGSCQIVKTSEDGKVDGINFTITGNGINQTVTTANGGKFQMDNLMPGIYTVTEQAYDKYEPQEKQIRFIDSHYNLKFYIPDGGKIRITFRDGHTADRVCKYIDDYHLYVGNCCYHICEFAEKMELSGSKVEPINQSEPSKNKTRNREKQR